VARVADEPGRALAAGVDLLLYSRTPASEAGYSRLVRDAARSAAVRVELAAAVRRIDALKSSLGLSC